MIISDQSQRKRQAGGFDIWSLIMNVVQIIGMVVTILALKHFTPLPFWACFLIDMPLFLFIFLTSFYLLFRQR